jgi:hypothetical protein
VRGLPLLLLLLLGACGVIAHGTSQNIVCISSPAGAVVTTDDGKTCTTPCTISLKRKKEGILTIEKEGYEPVTLQVRSLLSRSSAGQVLLPGGLICWAIDVASGGAYHLNPSSVDINLRSNAEENNPEAP